jgi:capsular polysaccharide transport system ATP-binding protein
MIRFENVVKRYSSRGTSKWILRGLSLEIPRGRSIGILGRNGAGKSTLIRMIAGAEMPDFGSIRRDCRVSWPLGFGGLLAGSMSGLDACMFLSRLYGVPSRHMVDFVEDFAELGHYFREPTSTYSSGMKARLSFGLSMAMDFDVYLVDELTAVGDSRFKAKCMAVFAERRERADVIMVSHSEKTVRDYCDMGAILEDGELQLFDDLDEAMARYGEMMRA